jgi:signal transduction histidine kinase
VPVSVAKVVLDRVSAHEVLAARQGVTLSGRSDRVSAMAVLGAVDQMLDNLIDNAVKASPRGSEVTVRAERMPGAVEIHVVDQGPGLSEEERRHAFERFWRSGATGRGGSGLGLAIVHRLAQASGGTAELRAAAGGGVDAVITLPTAPPGTEEGRGAGPDEPTAALSPSRPGPATDR